jgi:hypothetical protein
MKVLVKEGSLDRYDCSDEEWELNEDALRADGWSPREEGFVEPDETEAPETPDETDAPEAPEAPVVKTKEKPDER